MDPGRPRDGHAATSTSCVAVNLARPRSRGAGYAAVMARSCTRYAGLLAAAAGMLCVGAPAATAAGVACGGSAAPDGSGTTAGGPIDGGGDAGTGETAACAPRLAVLRVLGAPARAVRGRTVTFRVRVRSSGTAPTGTLRIRATGGGTGAATSPPLAVGAQRTVRIRVRITGRIGRRVTVRFRVTGPGVRARTVSANVRVTAPPRRRPGASGGGATTLPAAPQAPSAGSGR